MSATESTEPMTDQEYIDDRGVRCPFCRTNDIRGEDINIEGGACSQEVWCNGCGEGWYDVYELRGYEPMN